MIIIDREFAEGDFCPGAQEPWIPSVQFPLFLKLNRSRPGPRGNAWS